MFSAAWTRFGDTSIAAGGGALTDPSKSFPNSMHGGATPDGSIVVGFYVDMTAIRTTNTDTSCRTETFSLRCAQQYSDGRLGHQSGAEMVGTYKDSAGKNTGFCNFRRISAITLDVLSRRHSTRRYHSDGINSEEPLLASTPIPVATLTASSPSRGRMKRWLRNVSSLSCFRHADGGISWRRERTPDGACMERIPYDGCASHAVFRITVEAVPISYRLHETTFSQLRECSCIAATSSVHNW